MTKQEFISRRGSFGNRKAVACLVMFVVFLGCGSLIKRVCRPNGVSPESLSYLLAALVVCHLAALAGLMHQLAKRMGLVCPHCRKGFFGMSPTVITTGKCGHCGETVLDASA